MRGSLRGLIERWRLLVRVDDPPWRVALALAVGVFISCTPFWGVQTLLALAIATVFRLNRLATVTGAWLNLPWFAPFVYGAALKLGGLLLPDRDGISGFSVTLLMGTTIVGAVAAIVTYLVAFRVISVRRARAADDAGAGRRAA